MIKKIILWILLVTCMSTIFFLSSQEAKESSGLSAGFIVSIIRFFDVRDAFSEAEINEISIAFHSIVRKGAHFAIYAVLGFLIALLFGEYKVYGIKQLAYSVVCVALYSCSDEFHQSFVPGRSAQLSDVIIDVLGGLSGAVFAILISIAIRKITKKHHTE